jgi:prolyl-tRNA synthetase
MQDGKALQAGTSHFLGQNFAKAFDVKFADKKGRLDHVWATSWGVSTRLMGALIMCHSDDEGLVLPPRLAPIQVVAIPIYRSEDELKSISDKMNLLKDAFASKAISFKFDDDDNRRPGWKFSEYETKGVPVRLAMGPRDLENGKIEVARRDTKEKDVVDFEGVAEHVASLLVEIQKNLFDKALDFKTNSTVEVDDFKTFKKAIKKGGFVSAHWDGSSETEDRIKEYTQATIRCIPLAQKKESGSCVLTGEPSQGRVLFAKAY